MIEGKRHILKPHYLGFTQIDGSGASDLQNYLGIRVISNTRTFEYDDNLRFKPAWAFLGKMRLITRPLREFLLDKEHRGQYIPQEEAVFVRKDDPFVQCHEFGHVLVEIGNPKLVLKYAGGHFCRGATDISDCLALYSFDEGQSQWIAIQAGLNSGIPARVSEATYEHNKLVTVHPSETDLKYDAEVVEKRVDDLKKAIHSYVQNPLMQRGEVTLSVQQEYSRLLSDNFRVATALGYIYTASKVAKMQQQREIPVRKALATLITNPPTFAQLEEEVLTFSLSL